MLSKYLFSIAILSIFCFSCKGTDSDKSVSVNPQVHEDDRFVPPSGDIPVEPGLDAQGQVNTSTSAIPKIHETNGSLNWYEIQSALNYTNPEGKMYFIDVYTDWCGWCKVMDKKTFSDPKVQKAMNERFHMVKFNAEQKENITFNGQQYNWIDAGRNGINTLAVHLLGEQMGFPSYVYLDKNKKPITTTAGYQEVDKFLKTLSQIK